MLPNRPTLSHTSIFSDLIKYLGRFHEQPPLRPLMPSPSPFSLICTLHAATAATCGILIMFYLKEITEFGHGAATARSMLGSTPHDQLVVRVSNSFAGLLLVVIGCLVFMAGFVKDREFQGFFAKGCVGLHLAMALWRVCFERRLEVLARDWPRQVVGDFVLALSWVFFLVYTWRDMYD